MSLIDDLFPSSSGSFPVDARGVRRISKKAIDSSIFLFYLSRTEVIYTIKTSPSLLHRYRLREIAGLIHIASPQQGGMISKKLQRNGIENRA